ncbi:unnamed protein product [Amoebophrya sp. A25]|nr:unnamed protein product [Amoebophrya sp. A25]|eukprot:GSA25T00016598001.1
MTNNEDMKDGGNGAAPPPVGTPAPAPGGATSFAQLASLQQLLPGQLPATGPGTTERLSNTSASAYQNMLLQQQQGGAQHQQPLFNGPSLPHVDTLSSVSEPVSVDDLEAILRDWNIEDGDQILSVSSSRRGASQRLGDISECEQITVGGNRGEGGGHQAGSGVDLDSWTAELLGQLGNCENDHTRATECIKQFLKAFETQATAEVTNHRKSLANANRILLKTLQRVHQNHKQLSAAMPQIQKQLEEQRTRAEVAESRCKVLDLHLQHAMASPHENNMPR